MMVDIWFVVHFCVFGSVKSVEGFFDFMISWYRRIYVCMMGNKETHRH